MQEQRHLCTCVLDNKLSPAFPFGSLEYGGIIFKLTASLPINSGEVLHTLPIRLSILSPGSSSYYGVRPNQQLLLIEPLTHTYSKHCCQLLPCNTDDVWAYSRDR